MHKVLVLNKSLDDVFFVSKFMQGLNPNIQAAIILHKPRTIDVALSLALMQANVLEIQTKPFFNKNPRNFPRHQGKPPINIDFDSDIIVNTFVNIFARGFTISFVVVDIAFHR